MRIEIIGAGSQIRTGAWQLESTKFDLVNTTNAQLEGNNFNFTPDRPALGPTRVSLLRHPPVSVWWGEQDSNLQIRFFSLKRQL